MKVKIAATNELPGGFVIEAETPEDVLILRMFCADKREIYIANFGGNINEGRMTMLVQHRSGLTKHAPDVVESAASSELVQAESESTSEEGTTPATTQVM